MTDVNNIESNESNEGNEDLDQLEVALRESEEKLELAEQKNQEERLRLLAEFENQRRRLQQDHEKFKKYALQGILEDLLPVLDGIEQAAQDNEGTILVAKLLETTLAKYGLSTLNPEGEIFDPNYHEAISIQESDEMSANTVLMVVQKGYVLNDRVIRPARVIVSKAANA